jgi:hypothetical protein
MTQSPREEQRLEETRSKEPPGDTELSLASPRVNGFGGFTSSKPVKRTLRGSVEIQTQQLGGSQGLLTNSSALPPRVVNHNEKPRNRMSLAH